MNDIVGMCCVLNEEELIKEFIERTLPLVDRLYIAEGAVVGNPFCDSQGHSIDRTNEILDQLWEEDDEDKIFIIRRDEKWKSKQEQQNVMLDYVNSGEWCWIFGTDEFYHPLTRDILTKLCNAHPSITEFVFPLVNFWNDTKHIIVDKKSLDFKNLQRHQRFFQFRDYMFYVNHPTINDVQNRDLFFHEYYKDQRMWLGVPENYRVPIPSMTLRQCDVVMYHYGFCRDKLHQLRKHIYYLMRDRSMSISDAVKFIRKSSNDLKTVYGYIEQIHNKSDLEIIPYYGSHPLHAFEFKDSEINMEILSRYINGFDEIPEK
jgi:hypothetical protein